VSLVQERHRGQARSDAAGARTLFALLGMQRSGKSTVAWLMIECGVGLGREPGPARRSDPRGNIEDRQLTQLHKRILRRSGGSARQPPVAVRIRRRDRRRRDEILAAYEGATALLEDPRMLLLAELWRDLPLVKIAVLRNPAAVADAMLERWIANGAPPDRPLDRSHCEALWVLYNRALLSELRRRPFPVVDVDRPADLRAQVAAALRFHGWRASACASEHTAEPVPGDGGWRDRVANVDAVALWEELQEHATLPARPPVPAQAQAPSASA